MLPCTLTLLLAIGSLPLLLGACSSASPLPCGVVQKTAASLCCVVPFGHNFPRWGTLPCILTLLLAIGSLPLLLGACSSVSPLPCGVVQKTAASLCYVVPFGHNFPRW
ncbi:hypothetical protein FF1_035870 [Malus domestica]